MHTPYGISPADTCFDIDEVMQRARNFHIGGF